jgi:hypothetical protein
VKELTFRGRDRYRASWPAVAVVGLVLIGIGVFKYRQLGVEGLCILFGGSVVALVIGLGSAFRSWTAVGPAGITICWGFGRRGRTYPWRDIRWVDVRDFNNGSSHAAQIIVANGRQHSLPALRHTPAYPQATFYSDYRRVVEWWEQNTDPSARFVPRESRLSRWVPRVFGTLTILLIGVTVTLVITGIPGHH